MDLGGCNTFLMGFGLETDGGVQSIYRHAVFGSGTPPTPYIIRLLSVCTRSICTRRVAQCGDRAVLALCKPFSIGLAGTKMYVLVPSISTLITKGYIAMNDWFCQSYDILRHSTHKISEIDPFRRCCLFSHTTRFCRSDALCFSPFI